MPPKGHRRSDKERRAKEMKAAAKRNEVPPGKRGPAAKVAPTKRAIGGKANEVEPAKRAKNRLPPRPTGNAIVDFLQAQTPARLAALVEAAGAGKLTRSHVQAAMACELGTIMKAMKSDPEAFQKARPGYSIRRDILAKMLELAEGNDGEGTDIQIIIRWPARVGPEGGDQVKVSRSGAESPGNETKG